MKYFSSTLTSDDSSTFHTLLLSGIPSLSYLLLPTPSFSLGQKLNHNFTLLILLMRKSSEERESAREGGRRKERRERESRYLRDLLGSQNSPLFHSFNYIRAWVVNVSIGYTEKVRVIYARETWGINDGQNRVQRRRRAEGGGSEMRKRDWNGYLVQSIG